MMMTMTVAVMVVVVVVVVLWVHWQMLCKTKPKETEAAVAAIKRSQDRTFCFVGKRKSDYQADRRHNWGIC